MLFDAFSPGDKMKNDLNIPIKNIFSDLKDKIATSNQNKETFYVPNIIEFCESKKYLNLSQDKIKLYPFQKCAFLVFLA